MSESVELGMHYERFVAEQIAAGNYADAGEVIRAGLRLLETRELDRAKAIAELKRLIDEGIASGDAGLLDMDDIYRRAIEKAGRS